MNVIIKKKLNETCVHISKGKFEFEKINKNLEYIVKFKISLILNQIMKNLSKFDLCIAVTHRFPLEIVGVGHATPLYCVIVCHFVLWSV